MINEQTASEVRPQTVKKERVCLKDPAVVAQIVHVFTLIWNKSKENPNYEESFTKMMKPIGISNTNILKIKRAAIKRKIFIPKNSCNVRFRADLAAPSSEMILSLIKEERESKQAIMSSMDDISDEALVRELRNRGYKVSCEKTIKVVKTIKL